MYGKDLTIEELKEKLERETLDHESPGGGFTLLAVVPLEEFAAAHIPGSVHVPPEEARRHVDHYEETKQIVVYSNGLNAARRIATELREDGHKIVLPLRGSVQDWSSAGFDLICRPAAADEGAIEEGGLIEDGEPI